MYLEDATPYGATLSRSILGEDRTAGAVFVAARVDLRDLAAPPRPAAAPPHAYRLVQSPFAAHCSLTFDGTLAPRSARATVQPMVCALDDARRTIVWSGRRRWVRAGAAVVASEPAPLVPTPISPAIAFGGSYAVAPGEREGRPFPGMTVLHPSNPAGTGFHPDEESAIGHALPEVEWSEDRLSRVGDLPRPAVLCPVDGVPALAMPSPGDPVDDPVTEALRLAHPCARGLLFPARPACTRLTLRGFAPDLDVDVRIESPVRVTAGGPSGVEVPGSAVSLHVDLDRAALVAIFRHSVSARRGRRPTLSVWPA